VRWGLRASKLQFRHSILIRKKFRDEEIAALVYRLQNPLGFVAFKMGRL
jgi:hypothetical protein